MVRVFQWRRLLLILLLCTAFCLRLFDLTKQDIWWDEARNIDVALRPFWQIPTASELDIQPPLYYWLLHGWLRLVGVEMDDDPAQIAFFARFLSVFAGVVGVALLFALTKHSLPPSAFRTPPSAPLIATLLATLSPFWLAESQETRMYSVGMMFLMIAALVKMRDWQLEIEESHPPSAFRLPHFTFPFFCALALLTHYNALFILVAWYGWWGIWALLQPDRWRQMRALITSGLLLALLVAPMAWIALEQISVYENPNLVVPTVLDYLLQNWTAYLGGYAFDPTLLGGYGAIWLWGTLMVGGVGLLFALRLNAESEVPLIPHSALRTPHFFLLAWLVGGLALYYVAVMDRGAFNVRYSSFVTPALYSLLGLGLATWGRWWRPLGWIAVIFMLIGLPAVIRADLFDPRFFREDTQGVANWLRANTQAGDLILVDQRYPFGFYYQRYASTPEQIPTGSEAVDALYLFVDINSIDQQLNQWATNAQRIFWVQWFESDTDPRHAVRFLLDSEGQQIGSQGFQGYEVTWWQMRPATHFTLASEMSPLSVRFDNAVETIAVSAPTTFVAAKGIPIVIRWQRVAGGSIDRPLKARVALYNEANNRVVQADNRLLNDHHLAPEYWSANDQPLNLYWLETPGDLPSGNYSLRLLVYDAETLAPLTILDSAGNEAGIEYTFQFIAL